MTGPARAMPPRPCPARAAARQVRYQVRMVTLDGTELRTGGSYAGGANRNNNTIFIKPELDALLEEIK